MDDRPPDIVDKTIALTAFAQIYNNLGGSKSRLKSIRKLETLIEDLIYAIYDYEGPKA
jgi:hypothetical protein